MSDETRNEESLEEAVILGLLDPEGDGRGEGTVEAAPEVSRMRREYLELLGLVPYALEPRSPSPELRSRILGAAGAGSGEMTDAAPAEVVAIAESPARPPSARWLLPMAASIALVLMAVTGWLVIQVSRQQARIVELSAQLDSARADEAELATSRGMLAEMRSRLELVTAPGAQYCALRPPKGSEAEGAIGMVVMHPVNEEWFLRIEGLKPCSQGRKYVLWFSTEDGTRPGPIFGVKKPGDSIELTVSGRPPKIDAIMITLESDPMPDEPSMEPLLFGDERMQVL